MILGIAVRLGHVGDGKEVDEAHDQGNYCRFKLTTAAMMMPSRGVLSAAGGARQAIKTNRRFVSI